ncbi:beta-1,3-galactosyl-O-glycosyl-glycoprotein beta-1,6-N-acetylglucosaminyltransferase-like [Scleropages formosus]|uniref:Beta-1,3-galactosyl-O-glycosyl-glycoprotein beta-1,6-N-acetylglucosaminyltransferase-like n=1 Tax=Scleropages formosus TaxID=113540 RepID=A0A0P7YKG5_SCLFO|nr:beta-1,3-galactosyl-O-glycosyl-glycoprotein beta-1,6-N-acetylglucosaminyltransferase [Scleropages formosus]XP_029115418.1 beta-1,3-galactosyl-O-glycosyl-glycoprotein beta-1,6-N-acetylglucosaminyltransferase [Scleropages formosus]KPP68062.1 beta-1,3-galactosyl-O-glycosyl-glycoprotein beta-1,6-N-acetylglucosaminyltransferase-like [Scleropages formosus]
MLQSLLRCIKLKRTVLLLIFIITVLLTVNFQFVSKLDYSILEIKHPEIDESCNCTKILKQDREEMERSKLQAMTKSFRNETQITEKQYIEWTSNCEKFKITRKYLTFPLSSEEEEFPLAYSIVIHHKIQNFERLLRAIYAPQNFYCIHVDNKSAPLFQAAVAGIVSCFDNVVISSKLENVVYASWSRVQADINCMRDLYNMSPRWKYFINLCGQDFPIKTNLEIVRKLKNLNGKNNLETEKMPAAKEIRWKKRFKIVKNAIVKTNINKTPPPIKTPVYSGGAYILVLRKFVQYVLTDPTVQQFIEWSKDTYSPDEFLWATLQRQSKAPGSIPKSYRYDVTDVNSISRLVKWVQFEGQESDGAMYPPCDGQHIRAVCVYGVGDLSWMLQQPQLFANKFDSDMDYFAVYCLEQHLRHKALTALD